MYKNFDLTGKYALVVGGVGGIGKALTIGLAQAGADVAVADLNLAAYPDLEKEIKAIGKKCTSVQVDVTSVKSAEDCVAAVLKKYPRIDILVNAHGIAIREPAETFNIEGFRKVLDINTTGTFIMCQAVGKVMIKQKYGKIINLSSVRGEYGLPANYAAYCASKGGVNTLTKTLACEWAKNNVLVNAIGPTIVETELTKGALADPAYAKQMASRIPLGRWAKTDDLVGPVLFFASPSSDFVTGQILYIDGGVTTW